MKTNVGNYMHFATLPDAFLLGSCNFLQPVMIAPLLAATFANIERHVGLFLQAEGNQFSVFSVTQFSPLMPLYVLAKFNSRR
jgi:hypothetical protein